MLWCFHTPARRQQRRSPHGCDSIVGATTMNLVHFGLVGTALSFRLAPWMRSLAVLAVLLAAVLVGCTGDESTPVATDGPGEGATVAAATAAATPQATAATPQATAKPQATATPTPAPTATPTPAPTATPTPAPTATPTPAPTATPTPASTATPTPAPTATPTPASAATPTPASAATPTPAPTATPTPSPTATPTPSPTATPTPSPTATSPEEGRGSRIGATGDPIPELPDSVPGEQLTWRFPEPPHPQYPDRPFIVVAGEAIDSPEPWMHEHARALIEAHHRYFAAQAAAHNTGDAEPLKGLVSTEILDSTARILALFNERGERIESPPTDSGVVAIEFTGKPGPFDRVRLYTWLHVAPVRVINRETNEVIREAEDARPRTNHMLPSWRLTAEGAWELVDVGWASRAYLYESEAFVARHAPALLRYYLLNAAARRDAGVLSVDDLGPNAE